MNCKYCSNICTKAGKQRNGQQKWKCKFCNKYQQEIYKNRAYLVSSASIISLLKEGCGILSIGRLLQISPTTVIKRIREISKEIIPPKIKYYKEYEVDELCTYVQQKKRRVWVVYALQRDNKEVVCFNVGTRTNKTLRVITETLQLGMASKIYTDKLKNYKKLIDTKIHSTKRKATNHIERKHLTIRTHLKRLSRRSLNFSKSLGMLRACLTIYFWA